MLSLDLLTPTQRHVAELVHDGYTSRQIAAMMRVGPRRVRQIVAEIAERLHLRTDRDYRVQIAVYFAKAA